MIQQRPGDVLEIYFEEKWYYLTVVTKIYMFGGNIVYAFHGDGSKVDGFLASPINPGFNICTDLLLPKKNGIVKRIGKVEDPLEYLVINLQKQCAEHRLGMKAKEWWLSSIDPPGENVTRTKRLANKQELAMDSGMYSFDLATSKILEHYTPDKNPFIDRSVLRGLFS
tara:strand:- start:6555 stop:7058 length:504 start_codon:yes stop_codon:yes gene_type:complete